MGELVNLWQVEHYRRRRNLNAKLSKAQEQAERKTFAKHGVYFVDEADEFPENLWGAIEGKTSDNIRLTSVRPWKPDDDNDPECA